jgi:uncharacterized integral membrane protein (TIGR00698 family)
MNRISLAKVLIPVVGILVLFPFVGSAAALIAGVLIAVVLGNPYPTKNYTHRLLTWSVIGLGAGMNLETVARVGAQGIGYTVISIGFVLILGYALRLLLKVEDDAGLLITVGTAICGGSAIAAVTPAIGAKPHSVSVALGSVFILNALALIIFPTLGHAFGLSERAFGLWSALAIHDTSSVVGATVAYGAQAAEVGTTVKLARALWIVPLTFGIGFMRKANAGEAAAKAKKPWFILGFLVAAAIVTWIPAVQPIGQVVEAVARRALVLTLFFIGLGLSKETLKQVGPRPFVLALVLWLVVASVTLAAVRTGFIH